MLRPFHKNRSKRMDNEELNKYNETDNIGELLSDNADSADKLSDDELEKFGSELKDFKFSSSSEENEQPKEKPETDNAELADEQADAKPEDQDRPIRSREEQPQRRRRPDGQRPRQGEGRRPRPDGRRPRPDGEKQGEDRRPRPDGKKQGEGRRQRPDGQRPRPDGKRPRPDGKRPAPQSDAQRRRRPDAAGAQQNQGKKKKGWSKKKKTILITVVVVVLTLALIVGVILALFFSYTGKLNRDPKTVTNSGEAPIDSSQLLSKPDTINKEDQEKKLREMLAKRSKPITNDNVMNILIIGEDLRDTADDAQCNTDVQLLVSINKEKKKIVLASFLRDQYLNIEGFGMGRLNTAYFHNGIPLLKDTIAQYYNIHIDRYVKVNFYSFIDVVDEIGGVDMEVKEDEFAVINEAVREHNKYLNNPPEKDYVKQKGYQHLNGNQALAYARIREGCGDDYGRTERQRKMMTTIMSGMKKLGLLELNYLIDKIAPQITTDVSNGEIASLLLNASEILGYQVCQVQMPHYPYFTEEVINRMAVLVPDYDKNSTLLLDMIYGDSTKIEDSIQKMEAGTINQYTYTTGNGGQNTGQDDPNGQNQNVLNNQNYAVDPNTGQY